MKKILSTLFFLFFISLGFSQAYQKALDNVNAYLKKFDKGYYGYLEVENGYLFDRFPTGDYSKVAIKDLDKASTDEMPNKIIIPCKNNVDCVYSTFTDSNHPQMSFSQEKNFNEQELLKLLNDLISVLKADDFGTNTKKASSSAKNYEKPLQSLNEYLTKFNPETYRNIEVKEGKVYFSFAVFSNIYHSYITIDDLKNNVSIAQGNAFGDPEIRMRCNDERKCFYSNYSNDDTDHFRFFSTTVKDLSELDTLLKDFIEAL